MATRSGVKAGWLIISADQILEDYSLICEDGVVVDLIPNAKTVHDSTLFDARDAIVCPGFINTHNHMYNAVTRGIQGKAIDPSLSLKPMLEQWWWPDIEDKVGHEQIDITTRFAVCELLTNGVTCVDDILEAPNSAPGCLSIEAKILEQAGMRGVLSLESSERISAENGRLCLKENQNFIEAQRAKDSLVQGMMCIHTTFSCSRDFLQEAHAIAHRLDSSIQLHCSEGADEGHYCLQDHGMRPLEYYEHLGFLDEHVLAGQCVVIEPQELALLAQRNVRVTHQPISNCGYGCGIAPVPEMLDLGIAVGLGTDGYHNNYFETMRMAYLLHKGSRANGGVMPADVVLRMATELGAKALDYPDIGTLARGNSADYLVIDSGLATPINKFNLIEQLVLRRENHHIRSVVIAGVPVVERGQVLHLDYQQATRDLYNFTEQFWRR